MTELSGSFTIRDFDSDAFETLFGSKVEPVERAGEVRISTLDPVRCPSPWRHPIQWLRWNPFMQRRTMLVLPNCEVRDDGDGAFTLTPLPTEVPWRFSWEDREDQ